MDISTQAYLDTHARWMSPQEMLWSSIVALEERLCKAEQELQDYRIDSQKLLRSISSQLANKLARRCLYPNATPYEARHTTLKRIKKHRQTDIVYVQQLTQKYPDLEAGIDALNTLGIPIAHMSCIKDGQGVNAPATYAQLESLVNQHFVTSLELAPVRQVLACLQEVSKELAEEIFVDTITSPLSGCEEDVA